MNPLYLLVALTQVSWVLSDCGSTPVSPLQTGFIVGGEEARAHSLPWQISLQGSFFGVDMGHSCGGSIVSDRFIITAAHCIMESNFWKPYVIVGAHDITKPDEFTARYDIEEVTVHPQWNPNNIRSYDIVILKTDKPITFNDGVQPICIPEPTQEWTDNDVFVVSGWGLLRENGRMPDNLQQLMVPHFNHDACENIFAYRGMIHDNVICAGFPEGGKDACQGDSGGPLAIMVEDKWTLAGVVSWGIGCARYNKPGVYTHVAKYRDFIDQTIN